MEQNVSKEVQHWKRVQGSFGSLYYQEWLSMYYIEYHKPIYTDFLEKNKDTQLIT